MSTPPRKYLVEYTTAAARQVRRLEPGIRRRVLTAIQALTDDPRPPGTKALQGSAGYRIRIGDYRVLYLVDDGTVSDGGAKVTVVVFRVAHRGEVYRG